MPVTVPESRPPPPVTAAEIRRAQVVERWKRLQASQDEDDGDDEEEEEERLRNEDDGSAGDDASGEPEGATAPARPAEDDDAHSPIARPPRPQPQRQKTTSLPSGERGLQKRPKGRPPSLAEVDEDAAEAEVLRDWAAVRLPS